MMKIYKETKENYEQTSKKNLYGPSSQHRQIYPWTNWSSFPLIAFCAFNRT